MLRQALTVSPIFPIRPKHHKRFCRLCSPSIPVNAFSQLKGAMYMRHLGMVLSASMQQTSMVMPRKKRKVVEHICLLKTKEDLGDEEEKDMLDYLYTTQYQMRGIVAISLGRIADSNVENYTHAVYMRFQTKEDLAKFYENPFYLGVLNDHVMPYCHGLMNVDYESEVEDDILPIFRKGEEFNFGLEFVLLIAFVESAYGVLAEGALASLDKLTEQFPSLIVQSTQGPNFNSGSQEYTHGVVTRFRSVEAFEIFVASQEYEDIFVSKLQPLTKKMLPIHFSVDPVGTELM
ncbi:hypothetical protein HS088_TW06G00248 [Tripterygium wilfordii]|uniref:Stress-response A/B barrel domain-containing protein n=1 Tax=Tripterygium wilfordii TaxID=458696 RepID=A0A7J7DIF6_TRIWF|nr:stress-response A/B barrel domain-containing protein UP3 [Tripterygium wilfordii]KAF5746083.1 hypothetical protein HS088_TW06G00248 [Tripterygium wilfordii]